MEVRHHLLEFGEGEIRIGGVAPRRREEADRVVAPVVLQPLLEQVAVVDEGVDGEQLDRADAKRGEIVRDLGRSEPGIGAAQRFRNGRVKLGEATDMRLVDDRILPRGAPARRTAPAEGRVDHATPVGEGSRIAIVEGEVVAALHLVAEQGRVPGQLTDHLPGVRIEQQLVRVEAMAGRRLVGAVDAIAVDGAGPGIGKIAVPNLVRVFRQHDSIDLVLATRIEQAEFDLGRIGREQREIDAEPIPGGAQRVGEALAQANGAHASVSTVATEAAPDTVAAVTETEMVVSPLVDFAQRPGGARSLRRGNQRVRPRSLQCRVGRAGSGRDNAPGCDGRRRL